MMTSDNMNRCAHRYLRRNELNEHLNDNEENRCFDNLSNDENENENDNGLYDMNIDNKGTSENDNRGIYMNVMMK